MAEGSLVKRGRPAGPDRRCRCLVCKRPAPRSNWTTPGGTRATMSRYGWRARRPKWPQAELQRGTGVAEPISEKRFGDGNRPAAADRGARQAAGRAGEIRTWRRRSWPSASRRTKCSGPRGRSSGAGSRLRFPAGSSKSFAKRGEWVELGTADRQGSADRPAEGRRGRWRADDWDSDPTGQAVTLCVSSLPQRGTGRVSQAV